MGVALENARLFDQTQRLLKETERRERESSALSDVGRDLSSSLDLSLVMDRIAHHAKDLLQATDSAIFLPDPGGATHRAMVALGNDAEAIRSAVIEAGVGIIGTLLQSGEPELINDSGVDPRGHPGRRNAAPGERAADGRAAARRPEGARRDGRLAQRRPAVRAARARVPGRPVAPGDAGAAERAPVQRDAPPR